MGRARAEAGAVNLPAGRRPRDRRVRARQLATSDCERCRDGWISQPANTASSLAYVVAGAALAREARDRPADQRVGARALAAAVAAAGLGSVAYHGPGGATSRWAHDATLVTAAGLLAQRDLAAVLGRPPPGPAAVAAVPVVAIVACTPRTSAPTQVLTGALAIAAGVVRRVRDDTSTSDPAAADLALGAVWAAGAVTHASGRTGGPLCRPDSVLQAHAVWHVLSAVGFWLAARERGPR